MMLRVLDLFSGIGGFSLGFDRAGMTTVAFCEIDPFCRRVLAKHWPGTPIYDDVRNLFADRLAADGISVDVICGGFPCQDISLAGHGAGLAGERSGLWSEFARLIGEVRPRYVVVENVSALLGRGLGDVLGDLAAFGYDAEWHCIPASAFGAPHRRDRVWIVAHARCLNDDWRRIERRSEESAGPCDWITRPSEYSVNVADADCIVGDQRRACDSAKSPQLTSVVRSDWWVIEPDVGRVADGVSDRVDRLRGLGNAIVPQIAEMIGRRIVERVQ